MLRRWLSFANNDSNESPFTFQLKGQVAGSRIIDNLSTTSFSAPSGFSFYGGQGFANSVVAKVNANANQTATWTFNGLTPGTYRVSATWSPYVNRATNAPYSINGGTSILVNQRLAPNNLAFTSVLDSGSWFADLSATVSPVNGTIQVTLRDTAINGWIVADAIRLEKLSPMQATAWESAYGSDTLSAHSGYQSLTPETRMMPLRLTLDGGDVAEIMLQQTVTSAVSRTGGDFAAGRSASASASAASREGRSTRAEFSPLDVTSWLAQGIAYWVEREPSALGRLQGLRVTIQDLPGNLLGLGSMTSPAIWLDIDGAGQGWLQHDPSQRGYDLVTVVAHELGHVLGYADLDAETDSLAMMNGKLSPNILRGLDRGSRSVTLEESDGRAMPIANGIGDRVLDARTTGTSRRESRSAPIPAERVDLLLASDSFTFPEEFSGKRRSKRTTPIGGANVAAKESQVHFAIVDEVFADLACEKLVDEQISPPAEADVSSEAILGAELRGDALDSNGSSQVAASRRV